MANMNDAIEIFIVRADDDFTSEELKLQLEKWHGWDSSIQLDVRFPEYETRAIDPTFLTAICTAGGTVLGALITGVMNVAQALGKQKITIQLPDGRKIEVEGRNAMKTVEKLLPLIQSKTIITIESEPVSKILENPTSQLAPKDKG